MRRLSSIAAIIVTGTTVLSASPALAATTPVKSVQFCTTSRAALVELKKFKHVTSVSDFAQLLKKEDARLAKAKRAAPGPRERSHVKALTKHLDALGALAKQIGNGTPTDAQTAQLSDLERRLLNDGYTFGVDLRRDGCKPYLQGVVANT